MRYELIIYWSRADECFVVEVPELAGCMADGASYQEAVATPNSSSSNGWKPPANSDAPSPSRAASSLTLEEQEDSEILRLTLSPPTLSPPKTSLCAMPLDCHLFHCRSNSETVLIAKKYANFHAWTCLVASIQTSAWFLICRTVPYCRFSRVTRVSLGSAYFRDKFV